VDLCGLCVQLPCDGTGERGGRQGVLPIRPALGPGQPAGLRKGRRHGPAAHPRLRSSGALHLTVARQIGAGSIATLDAMMVGNAKRPQMKKYRVCLAAGGIGWVRLRQGPRPLYLLHHMGRIPSVGDSINQGPFRFEVVDIDGRRIDKVLVQRGATKTHRQAS